ncbi:MAG: hypothetical protein Q8N76_06665 [Candidatus Omnitrophota bacterium]|nr:hypothetical protein [Candidatus Omnitrophota bacterium]
MISLITWLWNIRHRKLIEETKAIMRLYLFLRHECGLREAERLSARELRELLGYLKFGE